MATQIVCSFFKFGYCKHKEMCRKRHVKEICENSSCDVYTCILRHPKPCKFFRNHRMCKFDPCMFSHEINNTSDTNLETKIDNLEKIISEKDDIIKQLTQKIDENSDRVKNIIEKMNDLEKLETINAVKQLKQIETLEKHVNDTSSVLVEKLNAIEKNKKENTTNTLYDEKIKSMEMKIYILEKRRLGSDFCEYCSKEFKLGCEKDRQEKEAHIRETHTFECKVCELKHNNKEELDIHLLTCEIYLCSLCNYKHKRLSELKSHCKTKHTRNTIIRHCKMDREHFSKLSSKNYFSEEV